VSHTIAVTATNALGTGPSSAPLDGVTPTTGPGVVDLFDDEFQGSSLSAAWTTLRGANPSNGEGECYSPLNVMVSGGLLREKAALGKTCGTNCPPKSNIACPYVSGAVQWSTLSFTYGTISVRAKMPGGVGTWPAIWLLGANCQQPMWIASTCGWPAPGSNEIDVAEILGSNQNRTNQRVHTEYPNGTPTSFGCDPTTSNVSKNWHTYTLIWAPGSLTWEIDQVPTCQVTTLVPSTPMFLIINTAVGGIGVGRVKNSTLPRTTEIDFVRVTQSSPS
jgi:beta-glucanase (GH16 family)